MANSLQISVSAYSKLENGHITIKVSRYLKIMKLLGADGRTFFNETETEMMKQEIKEVNEILYHYFKLIIDEQKVLIELFKEGGKL